MIPRKIHFRPDTGLVKRGNNMSPEEALVKLAHHEEKCDLRYQCIEARLAEQRTELQWLRKMMWGLIVAMFVAPWIQKTWGG